MASKQPDIINIRRKRSLSHSVPLCATPPGPNKRNRAFSKYGISPTISYQVSGLSPKTSHRGNDDFFSYRWKQTKKQTSKNKSSCENQGDVVKKGQSDTSGGKENDQQCNNDADQVDNNNADFLKLPRRALIRCPNDWEDEMPIDTSKMCVKVESKSTLSKETDPEDAPQSIDEIFNDILHCFVVNKGASPVRFSTSMPGCFGSTNSNTNHDVIIAKDDTDDEIDNPSLELEVDNYNSERITNIQTQNNLNSSSPNISQKLIGNAAAEVSTDFRKVECDSEVNIKKPTREKNKTLPAQIHSAFERARQLTRKAMSTVRSRSPTPQKVREAFDNVVQAGKDLAQRSREIVVAATCVIPNSDNELVSNQESIELEQLCQSLCNKDKIECDATSDNRKDIKKHGNLANNDPLEGVSMCVTESNMEDDQRYISNSDVDTHSNGENTGKYQLQRDLSEIDDNDDDELRQVDEIDKESCIAHIDLLDRQSNTTKSNGGAQQNCEMFTSEYKENRGSQAKKLLQSENIKTKDLYGHIENYEHLVSETSQNLSLQLRETIIESGIEKSFEAEEQNLIRPLTDSKSTSHDEEKVIFFKSSMSDVPLEDVTESDDIPRKTISLVTSNEADQDRDITEVMALISDEVSLKRYKSVNDLTELDKKEERSRSLSFNSNGKRRCLKLNNHIIDSSNIYVRDEAACNLENIACKNVDDIRDSEIDSKPFLNVLDPSYDTDDDQRSSDLSSCDGLSSRSGSQRKTTSSSLATPPNSPRVGIQAETVGTIVSLFETTSILCASTSLDDDLGPRSTSKTDYHALLDDELCAIDDSPFNNYEENAKRIGEYCDKQVDKTVSQECHLPNYMNGSKAKTNGEDNEIVFQHEKNAGSMTHRDIEHLVASLPSPPSADSLEGFILNADDTTAHDCSTSNYCENKLLNSNVNLDLLRAALQKENCSSPKENMVDEPKVLPPKQIGYNLGDTIKAKEFSYEDKKCQENDLIQKDAVLEEQTKIDIGDSDFMTGAHFDKKASPSCNEERDVPSMKMLESGGSLTRTDVIELPVLELASDTGNAFEEEDVDEVNRDSAQIYVGKPEITIAIKAGTDSCTEECPLIEENVIRRVDKDPGNDNMARSEAHLTTLCDKDRENKFLVEVIISDDKETKTTVNTTSNDIFDKENIEKNMAKIDQRVADQTSKDVQSIEPYCSGRDRKLRVATSDQMYKEDFTYETSIKRHGAHSHNELSPEIIGTSRNISVCNEPNFPEENACSSYSKHPETSLIESQSQNINPILVHDNVTHRPPRPAKIRWALENEILDKPVSTCSSQSDREDGDEEEEEMNNYDNAFDRCNSCLPKSQENLVQTSKSHKAKKDEQGITDGYLVGNSSKMAQFILYTGALFPSSTLIVKPDDCNRFALEVDSSKRRNEKVHIKDQDKCDNEKPNFPIERQHIGYGDVHNPSCQNNKNVNSDIDITKAEDGDNIVISTKLKSIASNENNELPFPKISPTNLPTTKLSKTVNNFKPTLQANHSHHIQKSHSLDSAIQINKKVMTSYDLSQIMFCERTSLALSAHSWPSSKQQSSEIASPVSGISEITNTFETASNFLDKMNERFESNLAGIHKTHSFIDRAQKHLTRCDQLILRSSATLLKSAQLSAKVRDQINRVDLFLASGKLASPHKTTCN